MVEIKKDLKKQRKEHIIVIVSIFVSIILLTIAFFLLSNVIISSSSMEPTLKNGWAYRLNRAAYWFSNPQRGDIIMVNHDNKSIGSVAKRIIGLPGEKIQIKDGKVYINDKQLEESYIREYITDSGSAEVPIILDKEEYFVLGDNPDESFDSRYEDFGLIHKQNIKGKISGLSVRNLYLRHTDERKKIDEE